MEKTYISSCHAVHVLKKLLLTHKYSSSLQVHESISTNWWSFDLSRCQSRDGILENRVSTFSQFIPLYIVSDDSDTSLWNQVLFIQVLWATSKTCIKFTFHKTSLFFHTSNTHLNVPPSTKQWHELFISVLPRGAAHHRGTYISLEYNNLTTSCIAKTFHSPKPLVSLSSKAPDIEWAWSRIL